LPGQVSDDHVAGGAEVPGQNRRLVVGDGTLPPRLVVEGRSDGDGQVAVVLDGQAGCGEDAAWVAQANLAVDE
jgi:hypothetical protein